MARFEDVRQGPQPALSVHASGGSPAQPWSFATILHPLTPAAFCSDYWGQSPLHLCRAQADFYATLITLADVERYLSMSEIFSRQALTIPRQGSGAPDPPPASLSELYERLLEGSSLRIRRMECFLDPAAPVLALLRDMELALQHPWASLSCYIAPPNAVGLGPHYDETEIFTLQIAGAKRWRLYHRIDSDLPGILQPEQLGEPVHDLRLQAGDLLYLPRGWAHEVTCEEPAFSLTLVFDAVKWGAVLDVLVAKLARTSPFLAAMPAGVLLGGRPEALRPGLEARLALIRDALASLSVEDIVDALAPKLVGRMTLPPDAQLDAVFHLDRLTLETVVQKRPGIGCHLTQRDGKVVLHLPGDYVLQASTRAEPALRGILGTEAPFRIAEMPGDLAGLAKLVLAKQLVACGLLRLPTGGT
jgi:hypothetical protein